jgi:hypothetical protein
LLTALAWSYGAGFPADVWTVVANARSATQGQYSRDDVYWLLGQASRYIVESGEGGHAVYRLSHRRLVKHLHPPQSPSDFATAQSRAAPVARALIASYRDVLESGLEPETPTYLWQYIWRHCADAGPVGTDALRQLATANPAFLPDLAGALNNLGNRYREIGQRQEANLAWNETLGRFAAQPAAFVFLALRRALARPPNELPVACADLYRCLSLTDLPMNHERCGTGAWSLPRTPTAQCPGL